MKNKNWEPVTSIYGTNLILDFPGGYISYNPLTHDGYEETAICVTDGIDREWAVLNGDYKAKYEEILEKGGGIKECLEFYKENEKHKSFWSTI